MTIRTLSPAISLDVHIIDQHRTYRVGFYGEAAEDSAIAFITKRREAKGPNGWSNHIVDEIQDEPIAPEFVRLYALLYPTCEHGLSASLCAGPQHYPYDDEERQHYDF